LQAAAAMSKPGSMAPSFGFRVLATGEKSSLAELAGRPVVIHFYDGS